MSVSNLYATVEELAPRAPSIITKDDEGVITDEARAAGELLLEAVSRWIDSKTRRTPGAFTASPDAATPRKIYGNGRSCLEIPTYIEGTIGPTIGVPTGYQAPVFVELHGQLCITNTSGVLQRGARWIEGVPYEVTARWGYAATPADIREACLTWAALRARISAGDITGLVTAITRDGNTLMRDDVPPSVNALIAPYILPERENEDDRAGLVEYGDIKSADDHELDPFKRYY